MSDQQMHEPPRPTTDRRNLRTAQLTLLAAALGGVAGLVVYTQGWIG